MSFEHVTRRGLACRWDSAMATEVGRAEPTWRTNPEFARQWTLSQAATALAKRTISSEELTKLCLARIDKLDRQLNAFITLDAESALRQARECDRTRPAGHGASLLYGIPIALKDNIDTAGLRTTAAAKVFKDRVPTRRRRGHPGVLKAASVWFCWAS